MWCCHWLYPLLHPTGSCAIRWENKSMYCIVNVFGLAIWTDYIVPVCLKFKGFCVFFRTSMLCWLYFNVCFFYIKCNWLKQHHAVYTLLYLHMTWQSATCTAFISLSNKNGKNFKHIRTHNNLISPSITTISYIQTERIKNVHLCQSIYTSETAAH